MRRPRSDGGAPVLGLLLGTALSSTSCAHPTVAAAPGSKTAATEAESPGERCRAAAMVCVVAARAADAEKLVGCMPDEVVDYLGGHDALVSKTRAVEADFTKHGVVIEHVDTTAPTQMKTGGGATFAVVTEELGLHIDGEAVDIHTYLLGVSHDGGRSWRFIDGQGVTPRLLDRVYPGFPSDLPLPTVGKPIRHPQPQGHDAP